MLAPNAPGATGALLLLGGDADGLELGAGHDGAALEEPVVDVGIALEGEVAAADDGGAVEAEDVARDDAGHAEGEADGVARGDEVRPPVDVDGDVMARLGGQEGEELADRVGDDGRRGRWRRWWVDGLGRVGGAR